MQTCSLGEKLITGVVGEGAMVGEKSKREREEHTGK